MYDLPMSVKAFPKCVYEFLYNICACVCVCMICVSVSDESLSAILWVLYDVLDACV